jgi:carbon-monoxide dehydrogenase medium subunit
LLTTAIAPNEILTEVRFSLLPAKTGAAYVKVPNKASHYAIVGVAAVVTLGKNGHCEQARIGLTGVTHKPQHAVAAESSLAGKPLDDPAIAQAAGLAADGIKALSDIHASAEFRLHLTQVMTGRALKLAVSRAQR